MISQNKAERPLNITSILNNFKIFIKQVYQKEWRQNINKKKERNNYFRAGINQNVEKYLHLKKTSRLTFNSRKNLFFFSNLTFIKVNLLTCISPTSNWKLFLRLKR